jgi:PAS domain S-box-containing protein
VAEGIIVFDSDLRYVVWNPFMELISGVPADKVLGKVSSEVFPHLKEQGVDLLHKRALNGETVISPDTPYYVPQSGRSGWVSGTYSPHRSGSGETIGVIGTIRDISERKKAEKTLRFLSLVTEQISDSVITTNLDYEITYANQSFQQLFGYSAEEILGKSPDMLNAEPVSDDIQKDIYDTVSTGKVWRGELMNRKKDGSTFHCGLLVFPLHDGNGKIFAYTGIQRDISEQKKAEQERDRLNAELASKNKELEQVVYATSHDLRTPLVNIDGFSKELEKSVSELTAAMERDDVPSDLKEKASAISNDEIPEALKYISLSISKMDSLLAGLLKLSRLGRAELTIKELDMNKLISDASIIFKTLLNKTGTKLEIFDLPNCTGDERQVSQIFSNLIDNAIKYLDPDRPCFIRISGRQENSHSIYCVEDNGVGIAEDHQEKIFDLFKQLEPSKNKGEGLGLTIVRKAVERQQGKIWLESESDKGSKFFISLPA